MIRVLKNRAGVIFDRNARARRLAVGKAATKRDTACNSINSRTTVSLLFRRNTEEEGRGWVLSRTLRWMQPGYKHT
ncbi:unnamed protein product [Ectocarpus sp. CCAP 1310/34]|nr:unnamed protein product [Ectocarpus sp. CCAP 1310/34]